MSTHGRSPFQVVTLQRYYQVWTPCCMGAIRLPRDTTDLVLTHHVPCARCDLAWRMSFLRDPRAGLRASWSLSRKGHE